MLYTRTKKKVTSGKRKKVRKNSKKLRRRGWGRVEYAGFVQKTLQFVHEKGHFLCQRKKMSYFCVRENKKEYVEENSNRP